MWCETPKSPPGDYNQLTENVEVTEVSTECVKHLNPRQGITTDPSSGHCLVAVIDRVKHLNPRQGITT